MDRKPRPLEASILILLFATRNPVIIPRLSAEIAPFLSQVKNPVHAEFLKGKLSGILSVPDKPEDLERIRDEITKWARKNNFLQEMRNVPNSGDWSGDNPRYRIGYDGRDGSFKMERLKLLPNGNHVHEILKVSPDGTTATTFLAPDKNKR